MGFEIVQGSFAAVIMTLFFILFIMTNSSLEKRTNRFFIAAAVCVLLLIIAEGWEALLASGMVYNPMRVPLSAIGYSLRPMIPYLLVIISKRHSRAQRFWLTIPLAVNIIVVFSALFCPLAFSYTSDNQFVRGPLGYMPFIVAGIYVAILLVITIRDCRRGGLTETIIVSAIVLVAFLATVLESAFGFKFIQNPSIATSITFYYLFLHSGQSNRDALTGVLNRSKFHRDSNKFRSSLTAVISMDVNGLKEVNDQFGHMKGDELLIDVTDVVVRHMGPRASLYRIGGDEFMVLCFKQDERHVQELMAAIRVDLYKKGLSCAMGYALCSQQADFNSTCQAADDFMYQDKRNIKELAKRKPQR